MSQYHDILSPADIEYILSLPDVISAKERIDTLSNHGSIQFKIALTDSIRATLLSQLNLDLSASSEIPMRWIKGDTLPHIDKGASDFDNTYLVYLNDSEGEFILEDTSYPIEKNTAFVFNEGLTHKTQNTGSLPRLLLGPMNELAQPVGIVQGVFYFPNMAATNQVQYALAYSSNYTVGQRSAAFGGPQSVAFNNGVLYVVDSNNHRIRRIASDGTVSTFAGSESGYVDGPANTAKFSSPSCLAFDTDGNLFVTDSGNNTIRKITPTGAVSTFAGSGNPGYLDGEGIAAEFSLPAGLAFDANGNLFVSEYTNRIRKITPTGTVTTFAGSGNPGYLDGEGIAAEFAGLDALAFDGDGNLLVSDSGNDRIRKITPSGTVTTFAGSSNPEEVFQDGPANTAIFCNPTGLAFDTDGNLYVTDSNNSKIRKITPEGTVSTFAGLEPGYEDGPANTAKFYNPTGLAFDTSGNLFIADKYNTRIRKITSEVVSTVAGDYYGGLFDTDTPLPSTNWKISENSLGTSSRALVYNNGQALEPDGVYYLYPLPSGSVCFLEGTRVLCLVDTTEVYLPIETLTIGTLVKTLRDGYKKLEMIAKEEMNNPGTDERIENRLYKCSTSKYPELKDDLFITGCHSILVDNITDKERDELTRRLSRIFVTDKKYRLIACADERAEPWNSEGTYTVWHFVLEHENPVMNYGVYVNGGLLVESCSKHVLKNKSNMLLQ